MIKSQLLYQLSYAPKSLAVHGVLSGFDRLYLCRNRRGTYTSGTLRSTAKFTAPNLRQPKQMTNDPEAKRLAEDIRKLAHGFGYPSRIADIENLIASNLSKHRKRLSEYMDICETLSRERDALSEQLAAEKALVVYWRTLLQISVAPPPPAMTEAESETTG